MDNSHLNIIKEYVEVRNRVAEKHISFSKIIDNEFDNGLGDFLYKNHYISIEEINEANNKLDDIHNIALKMYNLTANPNSLNEIEENAREYIKLSIELEGFYDKFMNYYEQYNLQGVD